MKTRAIQKHVDLRWIAAAAVLVCGLAATFTARADVTVIVNASNAAASLDDEAIANIFLGQAKTFPGGVEATPVNQKIDSPVAQEFSSKVLKKTPAQLRSYWAKQVFTGGVTPPRQLDGDEAVVKFVASTPGAIGYVDSSKVGPGVKVIRK